MTTPTSPRRLRIFRRDGYRCVYCGGSFSAADLTLDHVQPRVKGGDHSDGNLVTCCKLCNTLKAGEAVWSFLARDVERRENFFQLATGIWPRIMRAINEEIRSKTPL